MVDVVIIADSCALILLAKCTILKAFSDSFTIIIPSVVLLETTGKDLLEKYTDAKIISDLISENKLKVITVKDVSLGLHISMDKGEAEALVLSKQTHNSVLATDDGKAIKACRYLNIPFIISPRIVLELYRMDKIDLAKARSSIEKMRIIGRYSPDIIAAVILELEVIRDVKTHHS